MDCQLCIQILFQHPNEALLVLVKTYLIIIVVISCSWNEVSGLVLEDWGCVRFGWSFYGVLHDQNWFLYEKVPFLVLVFNYSCVFFLHLVFLLILKFITILFSRLIWAFELSSSWLLILVALVGILGKNILPPLHAAKNKTPKCSGSWFYGKYHDVPMRRDFDFLLKWMILPTYCKVDDLNFSIFSRRAWKYELNGVGVLSKDTAKRKWYKEK